MDKEQTQEISGVGVRSVESVKAAMQSNRRNERHHRRGKPLTAIELDKNWNSLYSTGYWRNSGNYFFDWWPKSPRTATGKK